MNTIFCLNGKKPVQFQGKVLIEGRVPNMFILMGNIIDYVFKYGTCADGQAFIIISSEKQGKEELVLGNTPLDLLKNNQFVGCIPEMMDVVRQELMTQDHSIYIEIGRVDYSKPFFAISIASKLYASQTPFIARNYGYYLFKDSEGFYLLSMYAGKITALGKHVTVQQLIDAEVNPHYATKLCFNAGIGLDDIEINTGKQGGIRAFPQAKWHNDLFLIGEKRQNIFGIMLSNYSTKGEVEDHYDSATGMLVRNVQYYLDTANKEIVCVYPKQNYFRFKDVYEALQFVSSAEREQIALNLGLPQAHKYFGIQVSDLFNNNAKNAQLYNYAGFEALVYGERIFSGNHHDVFKVKAEKNDRYVTFDKRDISTMRYYIYDDLGELLMAVNKGLSPQGDLNLQSLGQSYPQAFKPIGTPAEASTV